MEAVQNWKLCHRCYRPLPETEFRFRSKVSGDRMNHCRECTTTAQRQRRLARKVGATKRAMTKLNRQLARTTDAKRVSWLVSDTIDQLGGLHRFSASVRDHFDAVSADRLGSRETLNTLTAIINLSAASATLNPPLDPGLMKDDELNDYIQTLLSRAFVERLPDALLELERQGWRIEPPRPKTA